MEYIRIDGGDGMDDRAARFRSRPSCGWEFYGGEEYDTPQISTYIPLLLKGSPKKPALPPNTARG